MLSSKHGVALSRWNSWQRNTREDKLFAASLSLMCGGKFVALLPRDARSCSGGAISEANRGKVWRLIWLANCLEPACCRDTIRPEVFAAREFAKIADSSTLRTRCQSTSRIETNIPTAEVLRAADRLPAAQCETALLRPQLHCSRRAGVALGIVSRLAAVVWVLANLR